VIRVVVNLAASEAGWLACVSGAANGMPWAGPLVVLAFVATHLWLSKRPGPELTLVILAVLIGLVADSALVVTGLVSYPSGTWIEGFAPYWILAMWAMFATPGPIPFTFPEKESFKRSCPAPYNPSSFAT